MKNLHSINAGSIRRGLATRSVVFAAALAVCGLAGSATVHAQATAGEVFGKAPVGDTIAAHSMTNGTQRQVQVDARGRYAIRALPVGVYAVTLMENGQAVAKHTNVPVIVGRGIKVDFDCAQGQCGQGAATGQQ